MPSIILDACSGQNTRPHFWKFAHLVAFDSMQSSLHSEHVVVFSLEHTIQKPEAFSNRGAQFLHKPKPSCLQFGLLHLTPSSSSVSMSFWHPSQVNVEQSLQKPFSFSAVLCSSQNPFV